MQLKRATLATALVYLLGSAAAHAAAPWSPPLTIGPPSNGSEAVSLSFAKTGAGLLSWRLGGASFVAPIAGSGALGAARTLPADLAAGSVAPSGGGRAIVFLRRIVRPGPPLPGSMFPTDRSLISWALVAPNGTIGRVHALRTANCLTCRVHLAVNASGDAIAAWTESDRIVATWRPAGGLFERPVTVFKGSSAQYPDLAVAIGADGRAIVVDAGTVVRARMRTRRRGFGRVMRVGRGDESTTVTAAISNAGQTIVAWGSQDGGEEANEPRIVRAARLEQGDPAFSATQTLDRGGGLARPEGRIALAFSPGGTATVAWSGIGARATFPVMAVSAARGHRFPRARQLAPSGAVGGVAVRRDGAAVVAWSRVIGSQQPVQVYGSVRPARAAAFGAPEEIGSLEAGFFPPIVAFDPASGRPTVAWGSRSVRTDPPIADDATIHVATRTAP